MADVGVWFAVTEAEAEHIFAAMPDWEDIHIYGRSVYEVRWDTLTEIENAVCKQYGDEFYAFAGSAWWIIHCCLCGGVWDYEYTAGAYPLRLCVLGGKPLFEEDWGLYAFYVTPSQVNDIVLALPSVSEIWFREQYWKLATAGESADFFSEDELMAHWTCFEDMGDFYRRAAPAGRGVFFTFG